ncbi:hypothetical protein WS69_01795 [Burkholderia sp. BDU5]|nr:hypothetical protein WS69_01795 [Burkholderia sp. BDU5]
MFGEIANAATAIACVVRVGGHASSLSTSTPRNRPCFTFESLPHVKRRHDERSNRRSRSVTSPDSTSRDTRRADAGLPRTLECMQMQMRRDARSPRRARYRRSKPLRE